MASYVLTPRRQPSNPTTPGDSSSRFALIIGIAFVPSVKSWYIGQIERHAEHISRELQDRITPDLEGPPKSSPAESAALAPASLRLRANPHQARTDHAFLHPFERQRPFGRP